MITLRTVETITAAPAGHITATVQQNLTRRIGSRGYDVWYIPTYVAHLLCFTIYGAHSFFQLFLLGFCFAESEAGETDLEIEDEDHCLLAISYQQKAV